MFRKGSLSVINKPTRLTETSTSYVQGGFE